MKISIENIGKIKEAKIEINGITVLAGENNSGKSTIGKVLYSSYNSLYKYTESVQDLRNESIANVIDETLARVFRISFRWRQRDSLVENIIRIVSEKYDDNSLTNDVYKDILLQEMRNFEEQEGYKLQDENNKGYIDSNELETQFNKLLERFNLSDLEILKQIIDDTFQSEFSEQINNIFDLECRGTIQLTIKEEPVIKFEFLNHSLEKFENPVILYTDPVYIDNPNVIDDLNHVYFRRYGHRNNPYRNAYLRNNRDHTNSLISKLINKKEDIVETLILKKNLQIIFSKIEKIVPGTISRADKISGYEYKESNSQGVNVTNLSDGLKTFVIIKTLIENNNLKENGMIILDEPEIHLHPNWQLVLAEIIVLIQKEFNMHILLATHSPYFLRAIEVYSAKHKTADLCKYYKTNQKNGEVIVEDLTNNTDKIYTDLSVSLETLLQEENDINADI